MTFQDKVEQIGKLHEGVVPNVYHYFRPQLKAPYAIWQENGTNDLFANNQTAEQAVTGSTDYFTKTDYDHAVDAIQDMFGRNGFLWRLNSVQYESETGLIHYEWFWVKS